MLVSKLGNLSAVENVALTADLQGLVSPQQLSGGWNSISDFVELLEIQVIDEYCGQSFRLLALAKGVLKGRDRRSLCLMSQEQLEKQVHRFELLGLLVLSNHLRPDSKPTIIELQQE